MADVAEIKRRRGLDTVKMVMITNASRFHRPSVREALAILDRNQGEIWAKLDAGTDAYFHRIDRTPIPFHLILTNLRDAARIRPLVIQSLFMRVEGVGPVGTAGAALSIVGPWVRPRQQDERSWRPA